MHALVTGIAAFFIAALGALCPHELVYVPSLLSIIVSGGYVGGTIFSLQSEGVYDLRIREGRALSSAREGRLGGIWAYGLVGIPAGAIALLIAGRMVGVDDSAVAEVVSAGYVRRMAMCLGLFSVTVVGGFLGLNLIRVVSDRMKAEIQRQVSGEIEPIRLLEKGKMLLEEQSYAEALDAFRALARRDSSLLSAVWQGRVLKRMGRLSEAIEVLRAALQTRAAMDDQFRRAVALWNLGCYRALEGGGDSGSAIDALDEAIRNAPQFREALRPEGLDEDLASLVGDEAFEEWRRSILKRGERSG
jgi:tetratricopeptide (TPR) repeat protein